MIVIDEKTGLELELDFGIPFGVFRRIDFTKTPPVLRKNPVPVEEEISNTNLQNDQPIEWIPGDVPAHEKIVKLIVEGLLKDDQEAQGDE